MLVASRGSSARDAIPHRPWAYRLVYILYTRRTHRYLDGRFNIPSSAASMLVVRTTSTQLNLKSGQYFFKPWEISRKRTRYKKVPLRLKSTKRKKVLSTISNTSLRRFCVGVALASYAAGHITMTPTLMHPIMPKRNHFNNRALRLLIMMRLTRLAMIWERS